MTFLLIKESAVGFVLGYAGMIIFATLRFVGDFVEMLIGMSDAGMIDPLYNEEVGALGQLQFLVFYPCIPNIKRTPLYYKYHRKKVLRLLLSEALS